MAKVQGQLSIDTPELVTLQWQVAGFGSRALAVLLDSILQGVAFLAFVLLLVLLFPGVDAKGREALWMTVLFILVPFLLQWGYFALFEAWWHGQTPGKRAVKVRVIKSTGRPITLFESITRNFIRFVDMLPAAYLVGIVSVLVTQRQQRLGDLAAGTLVVHQPPAEESLWAGTGARTFTASVFEPPPAVTSGMLFTHSPAPLPAHLPMDQLARLTMGDVRAVEGFLARRLDLPLDTREALATKLAARVTEQTGLRALPTQGTETFLEETIAGRRSISGSAD